MELIDLYGRKIDYVRVSVTDRCNLRCIYCRPDDGHKCRKSHEGISNETVLRFLRACKKYGLKKVRLTGGEPLLRADILSIVRDIKALGVEDLSLTTNGIYLDRMADSLRLAGLDRVNISLDSLDGEKFSRITGGGSLDGALRGIESARNAGFGTIKINMVPVRGVNEEEIPTFARLTLEEDIHIRFIELMPLGDSKWQDRDRITSGETTERLQAVYGPLESCGDFGSSRNYKIPGAKGVIGLISPMSRHFCDSCNRLRLKSSGHIRTCLFSDDELLISNSMTEPEIENVLKRAVQSKPKGRGATASIPAGTMSQIGG